MKLIIVGYWFRFLGEVKIFLISERRCPMRGGGIFRKGRSVYSPSVFSFPNTRFQKFKNNLLAAS